MVIKDLFGIMTMIVVLAGITYAIANSGNTVRLMSSGGDIFDKWVRTATQR